MKWCVVAFVCCLFIPYAALGDEVVSSDWESTFVGVGTKPALAFAPTGELFVMGMTEEFNGVVWLGRSQTATGPWNPIDVATGYFYGPGDLAIDSAGGAHLAWHDHDLQDGYSVSIDAAGGITGRRVLTPNSHDGWDNSIAVASDGRLVQSSVNPSSFGASESLVYSELHDDEWISETLIGSGSFMYGFNTSLALAADDTPHILFTAAEDWTATGDLVHATRNDGEWTFESVVTGGARGRFPSLEFDHLGVGHAAWLDIDQEEPSHGTVRYGRFENGSWMVQDVDGLNEIELGFSGGRKQVSLALDESASPHIAYGDRLRIGYAKMENDQWDLSTILESDELLYNGQVDLDIAADSGAAAIAYWQLDDELGAIIKVLSRDGVIDVTGDFDENGRLDAADIDLLRTVIDEGRFAPQFDVTQDGFVDGDDFVSWIEDAAQTYPGDATLDGQFDASDLVTVFRAGEYEDGIARNSGWATGDWNADFEFDSSDLVAALAAGGYEAGPRVAAVPEPTLPTTLTLLLLLIRIRSSSSNTSE